MDKALPEKNIVWDNSWWLPMESLWSAWNHFLDVNVMTFKHFFSKNGLFYMPNDKGGLLFDKDVGFIGFTKKNRESLYDLLGKRSDHLPFEKLRSFECRKFQNAKSVLEKDVLRICPVCMSLGYHSILHQITCLDKCFIHNAQSLITTDVRYGITRDSTYSYGRTREELESGMDSVGFPDALTYIANIEDIRNILPDLSHLEQYKEINILSPWDNTSEHPEVSEKVMDFVVNGNYAKNLAEFTDTDREKFYFSLFQTHVAPILFQGLSIDPTDYSMNDLWDSYVRFVIDHSRNEKIDLVFRLFTRSLFSGVSDEEIISFLKYEHPDKEKTVRIIAKTKLIEAMSTFSPYEYNVVMGKICWLKKTFNYSVYNRKPTMPFVGNALYNQLVHWFPFDHDPTLIKMYSKEQRFDSVSLVVVMMMLDQITYMMDQLDRYISKYNVSSVDEIDLQKLDLPVYLVCTLKGEEPVYKILRL